MSNHRPAVRPPAPWRFPPTVRHQVGAGLTVDTIDLRGQYLASIVILLDVPLDSEPRGLDGVVAAMANLLNEGAAGMSGRQFLQRLEAIGATWRPAASLDGVRITVDLPVSRLADALALIATALRAPRFSAEAVDRYSRAAHTQLAHDLADPAACAALAFHAAVAPPGSRAGRRLDGDADSLGRLSPENIAEAHRRNVAPARTTLVLAGDLSGVDVPAAVERAFAGWDTSTEPAVPGTGLPPGAGEPLIVVDRPGAAQTQLMLGCRSADRRSPDWLALRIAALVLGRGMSSRINAALRQTSGYTYGLDARFVPLRRGGTFFVAGAVATAMTGPALADLRAILVDAYENGFTDDECMAAAAHLVHSAPATFETAQAVARQRAELVSADLDDDFLDRYMSALPLQSADDVSDAFARHVDVPGLTLAAVGDATTVTTVVA
ncbi:M16 family metallopeptidase [Micromonospora sp. DT228]|uniref:M16 family metallopeptidase n=1 Tax=Micromonospora sp. DT228 TaxID=3393443 RepID=UPI003CE8AE17